MPLIQTTPGLPADVVRRLRAMPMLECAGMWETIEESEPKGSQRRDEVVRGLILADLFYLLVRVCGRKDMLHPWVYARCREVENDPDDVIDLWFREGYKSTIKTFGLTMQDIFKNPDVTVGIFSHTRPIAKAFLRQIMREFESNKTLHVCFPDILWGADTKQAPKWSEDDGIIVRRKSNPNEATIEAWGLVDSQPTSKHFAVLTYDDVVTDKSVGSQEMIEKTTDAIALSYNLGKRGGARRWTGTYYAFADTYHETVKRGTARARIYPVTEDGTETGKPVLLSAEQIAQKRRDMGPYIFGCQMLLNPVADALQGFQRPWLRTYRAMPPEQIKRMNVYILVDAANAKRKESDYTSMWAIGLNVDRNMYELDHVRDRLNLTERTERLFTMHRKFADMGARIIQVRYERYGMMADIQHIKTEQERQNYRFDITEVAGQAPKDDRIRRLIPIFEQGHFYLLSSHHVADYEKKVRDLTLAFIEEEYIPFPMSGHKDMLDSLSRIAEPDLPLVWPKAQKIESAGARNHSPAPGAVAWMGA